MEASMPKRIQRSRRRGWRLPEDAVYVGRPTKWGNPFVLGRDGDRRRCVELYRERLRPDLVASLDELRSKDLACWCPLDEPCHADVLLELANRADE